MSVNPERSASTDPTADLEAMADDAIAACDGDVRATVKVLLVALNHAQSELVARDAEMAKLLVDVSRGFARGRWECLLERAEEAIPYTPEG